MGFVNLASKYSKAVDERFHKESQAMLALNDDHEFTGVQSVKVYSIPVVAMNDYQRSGTNRYGTPEDLGRNVQEMIVQRDRSFTFVIDKGDKTQSMNVSDAGKALARQLREVCVPEFDTYVFKTLANAAIRHGSYATDPIDKSNAYEKFLAAMEYLGNHNVPDKGRVCFCSYKFANFLKQDPAFIKTGDKSQDMLEKGVIGEVDGCKIVKVSSSRLPAGAAFLITHKMASTAPKQLTDYKIHENAPGINGFLVEGRLLYDCFVLDEKMDAIYYHGGQSGLKNLVIGTGAAAGKKSTLVVVNELEAATNELYYMIATDNSGLTAVTAGNAITTSAWTKINGNSITFTPAAGHTAIRVVEVDSNAMPVSVGDAKLNIG